MATQTFSRVAVLGLGLMGGSLGLALHETHLAATVVGYDADAATVARALARGAIDIASASGADAVVDADLVVLAAPVLAERELLATIAPALSPGAVVTDLGSTKRQVVEWAQELLLVPSRFIGGHPMTGREQSGIEAATPALFSGAIWCLTPADATGATAPTDPAAVALVAGLTQRLEATALLLDPTTHDKLVAGVSHLPHIAAAALVHVAADDADWDRLAMLAAGGFRDTTRVASGDARMARDICLTNHDAILPWLDRYIAELGMVRQRLAGRDADIESWFTEARELREDWLRQRHGS